MVGQFLRDFLFKNMITIQGDGHIAVGQTTSETLAAWAHPTLFMDLKD